MSRKCGKTSNFLEKKLRMWNVLTDFVKGSSIEIEVDYKICFHI